MFGEQFYPTPPEVISKMLQQLEGHSVRNVLEPSAGKGDILKAMRSRYYHGRTPEYFACEIDYNLRAILKDQYVKLIGFDFLSLDMNRKFDTIIMNPPFENGATHILKAYQHLEGGVLVCLLNRETIDNPCDKHRKLLAKVIEDNDGKVEYLGQCFSTSERKTDVDVVMVTLKKEKKEGGSIFEGFEASHKEDYDSFDTSGLDTEIMQGTYDINHIITTANVLKKQAIKTIEEKYKTAHYMSMLTSSFSDEETTRFGGLYILKELSSDSMTDASEEINSAIAEINRVCWSRFFLKSSIRDRVTTKVYEDFLREYSESEMDFNKENISMVVDIVLGSSDKIFTDSVNEIFDYFTKYHHENRVHFEGWKTNECWKVGPKIILPYMAREPWSTDTTMQLDYKAESELHNINKVFKNISEKSIMGFDAFSNVKEFIPGRWYESDIVDIKLFKKRTMHIRIKDKYLLEQFNKIVCQSRNWLPPVHSKEVKEETKQTSIL